MGWRRFVLRHLFHVAAAAREARPTARRFEPRCQRRLRGGAVRRWATQCCKAGRGI